ncbi:MAG: hypothetical protein RBU37_24400 [Myxococcota bacterium]|nr:hypothetical protein [Myxococcota bacterium]
MKSLEQLLQEEAQIEGERGLAVQVDERIEVALPQAPPLPQGFTVQTITYEERMDLASLVDSEALARAGFRVGVLREALSPALTEPDASSRTRFEACAAVAHLFIKPPPGRYEVKTVTGQVEPRLLEEGLQLELRLVDGEQVLLKYRRGEYWLLGFVGEQLVFEGASTSLFVPPLGEQESTDCEQSEQDPMAVLQPCLAQEPFLKDFVDDSPLRPLVYRLAVVLGLFQRLSRPSAGAAKAAVARLLAGELPEAPGPGEDWMRGLAQAQRRELEAQACLVSTRLTRELEFLEAAADDSEGWHRRVLALMQEREQLEGVFLLLQRAGEGAELGPALELLDDDAALLFERLPVLRLPDDPLLRRARIVSPDAWWTQSY